MKNFILVTLATTTLLLFLTTTNANNNVLDVYGESVVAGGEYYIVPYEYNPVGGGFSWKEHDRPFSLCPEFDVYQLKDDTKNGEPAAFYPTKRGSNNKITLSTDVNIIFPEVSPPKSLPWFCDDSSNVWKVGDDSKKVLLGGKKGAGDSKSVFSIKELDSGGYGIYFCNGGKTCSGLGIDPTSNDRRLVLNGTKPIPVVFESEEFFLRKYARYAV